VAEGSVTDSGLIANNSFWEEPHNLRPGQPAGPVLVDLDGDADDQPSADPDVQITEMPDGTVRVAWGASAASPDPDKNKFDSNLAELMETSELSTIAEDLLEGIDSDERSREQWISDRKRGLDQLGIKLEPPRSEPGGGDGAPLEGMATTRDPIITEAVIRGQANAIGEFLPAGGPVKVQDEGMPASDAEAEELEKDFNHYLTATATEYYPDTRRMLAWCYFGGSGIKKIYHCPLRRRPVSESVPMQDFIVSNDATDLLNAERVTHKITMRRSQFKRMVLRGVYRDLAAKEPVADDKDSVTRKIESIEGRRSDATRPEDQPYTLYETCCELDLDRFAPAQFRGKGVPLPYKATIEKDSRQIVALYRHWDEDDEDAKPKELYVKYSYIDWIGFYGLGILHVVGNLAMALTAMLRISIDNGMFANFPGGLIGKGIAGKQESNIAPVGPGQFRPIDLAGLDDIRKVAMALPFKDVGQGMLAVMQMVHNYAQRISSTADLPIGEGKQDAPVGTTLALLEQATKVESAVHKGMHNSQSHEFRLLTNLFREDPEAFWRYRKRRKPNPWTKGTLLRALQNWDLVPQSDPNTPSHIHRVMKAVARLQMAQSAPPGLFDLRKIYEEALRVLGDANPDQYFLPPQLPAPPQPDPRLIEAQAKQKTADVKEFEARAAVDNESRKLASDAATRQTESALADKKLATELVIHAKDAAQDQANADRDHSLAAAQHGLAMRGHTLDALQAAHGAAMDVHSALQQQQSQPPDEGTP
jgi:hypothetical protein